MTVVFLCLHCCALQASGKAMGIMEAQERAYWLNLSSLSYTEKIQLFNVPVDPKGLLDPTVASMQQH